MKGLLCRYWTSQVIRARAETCSIEEKLFQCVLKRDWEYKNIIRGRLHRLPSLFQKCHHPHLHRIYSLGCGQRCPSWGLVCNDLGFLLKGPAPRHELHGQTAHGIRESLTTEAAFPAPAQPYRETFCGAISKNSFGRYPSSAISASTHPNFFVFQSDPFHQTSIGIGNCVRWWG